MTDDDQGLDWNDRRRPSEPSGRTPTPPPMPTNGQAPARALKALSNECQIVASATEGTRNATLNEAAFILGGLVGGGSVPEQLVIDNLVASARQAGLTEREILPTIRSGLGKGKQHPRTVEDDPPRVHVIGVDAFLQALTTPASEPVSEPERVVVSEEINSWAILPLRQQVTAMEAEPKPTHLTREDGHALFYPGKVNGVIGEAESGKSWLLLLTISQALARSERVLLLDFEDAPPGIMARLRALQVEEATLDQLAYLAPPGPIGPLALRAKLDEIALSRYGLIVVDGINAAMTLLGLDLLSNVDATRFFMGFLRPLTVTGAAVVTADHVPKDPDQRGKGGIGAQAKRAMMDGCCLAVEVIQPFGRGHNGILRLRVDKDRPGHVRGISSSSSEAGRALLTSLAEERINLRVAPPDLRTEEERGGSPVRRTGLMEKISRYLESTARAGLNEIVAELGAKKSYVRDALTTLIEEGYVWTSPAPRNGTWHLLRVLYRQSDDPLSDLFEEQEQALGPTGSHWVPNSGGDPVGATGSRVPPPTERDPVGPGPSAEFRQASQGLSACRLCHEEVDEYKLDEDQLCPACHRRTER